MRPRLVAPLAALLALFALVSAVGAAPPTSSGLITAAAAGSRFVEAEPNNAVVSATPIGSGVTRGSIDPNADVDYYSFTAAAGDRLYAATMTGGSANGSTDSLLALYAADGTTVIESDDDNGSLGGLASSIAGVTLPSTGTYYLRVAHFSATSQLRPYDLYLQLQSGAPTAEVEPNADLASATPLPASGWVSGATVTGDIDFYSLSLNAGDTVFASLDLDPERDASEFNGRLGIFPFNNFALVVNDAGDPGSDSEALFMTVKNSGTYAIYVDSTSGAGTYQLSVTVFPPPVPAGGCTTYTSADTPVAVPSGPGLVSSTITIPDDVRIGDVDVLLTLSHANMADLDMVLTSPAGNALALFTDVGNGTQPDMDLRLDDDAAIPINSFVVMKDLVYQPEFNARLQWFEGAQAGGLWTLQLYDDAAGSAGTLQSWGLRICEQPEPAPLSCPAGLTETVIYSSGFEDDDGGFSHGGTQDEWERGTPTAAPLTGCAEGDSCWKTDLDSTYNANSNQNLTSPAIDLTAYSGAARLRWAQKYQLEDAGSDQAWFEVRNADDSDARRLWDWQDGTMNVPVGNPTVAVQSSSGWSRHEADISAYLGRSIELNAHLDSNVGIQFGGYAIDEVSVSACAPIPDAVAVTKVADRSSAAPGETINYTITYTNTSAAVLYGVVISDVLDLSRLTDVSYVSGRSLDEDPGETYRWTVAEFAPGDSDTITVTGVVRADATLGVFTNTVQIGDGTDGDPTNDIDAAPVTIVAPALSLAKSVNDTTPAPGQTVTYTLAIDHAAASSATAHDLVITDTLPTGLSYVPGSASLPAAQVDESGAPTIVFRIPTLALGASTSFTYQATVAATPAVALGAELRNDATLTWSSAAGPNANERLGSATASIAVTPSGADLSISKSVDPPGKPVVPRAAQLTPETLRPGQPVTYTIGFHNDGNLLSSGVTITDVVPAELVDVAFAGFGVSVTDTGATPAYVWSVANLEPGQGGQIVVTGRVDPTLSAGLTLTNVASIGGSDEINPANNSASISSPVVVPVVSIGAATNVIEGASATLTITLDAPNPYAPSSVSYVTVSGSATAGADFTGASGTVTIPAGATSATITLVTLPDALAEGAESFTISLSAPSGAALGSPASATVTIADDDTPGVFVSAANLSVAEGGATATYSVRLLSQPGADVAITLLGGSQLLLQPASLSFTAANWSTPQTITVAAVDDSAVEGAHSATITHSVASADTRYSGAIAASVAVSIADNDSATALRRIYLPLLGNSKAPELPDLTVRTILTTGGQLQILVTNIGAGPVTQPFWVDLYIDPDRVPTAPNEVWHSVGARGMVWGVNASALPLVPGASVTLTPGDQFYDAAESGPGGLILEGTPLYVQADSANLATTFGAVLENHERDGGAYNNIAGSSATAPIVPPASLSGLDATRSEGLPSRQPRR